MLIRVLLPNGEEEVFNADCPAIFLLNAIRRRCTGLASDDIIDLCSIEGSTKELSQSPHDNAAQFFTEREQCLVVKVSGSSSESFAYVPLLTEYSTNQEFLETLNHRNESVRKKTSKMTNPSQTMRQTESCRVQTETVKNRKKSEIKTKKSVLK